MAAQNDSADTERQPARRSDRSRIQLFIDNSNMSLTIQNRARQRGESWRGFDWGKLPDWLVRRAAALCRLSDYEYAGANVYVSHDPNDASHDALRRWVDWLDLEVGIQVSLMELRPRSPERCRQCGHRFEICPACSKQQHPRVEKGVDTAMVTDMMRMGWDDLFDIAVLVSSDSDFAPAVDALTNRGLRVIQAGVPPLGVYLRRKCWGSFDMYGPRTEFERPASGR